MIRELDVTRPRPIRIVLATKPESPRSGDQAWCRSGTRLRPHPDYSACAGVPFNTELLDLDAGAGLLELGLGAVGLCTRDGFADGFRGRVHEVLGFLESEAGDLTDRLDDVDLGVTGVGEDDSELGLLLGRGVRCRCGRCKVTPFRPRSAPRSRVAAGSIRSGRPSGVCRTSSRTSTATSTKSSRSPS